MSLINRCGFNVRDRFYGVVTRDSNLNHLGIGDGGANDAPILFTTHEMLRRRLNGKSFAAAREFHFKGGPRSLRIWDEAISPAKPITVNVDDLTSAPKHIRRHHEELAELLCDLAHCASTKGAGGIIEVPSALRKPIRSVLASVERKDIILPQFLQQALGNLAEITGRSVFVRGNGGLGLVLVGSSEPFPDDIKPIVALDASGRVGGGYRLWEKYRTDLVRLPAVINDYRNLQIRLARRAVGRDKLADRNESWGPIRQVAKFIDECPTEEVLLISFKPNQELDVYSDIKSSVSNPEMIRFTNWGRHIGTNEYKDISRIIILGSWFKPNPTYTAMHIAFSNLAATEVDEEEVKALRAADFQDNILQALCRASVRKVSGGASGECTALIVVSQNPDPRPLILATFPGCKLVDVTPARKPSKQVQAVLDVLRTFFLDQAGTYIAKSRVGEQAGGIAKDRLTKVLKAPHIMAFCEQEGIEMEVRGFRRLPRRCEDE